MQTTEMHLQSMNQLGERLPRFESQPQSISQIPASGNSAASPVREEHGNESRSSKLGPSPKWRYVGPRRPSEVAKPPVGSPARAKSPTGSMGGAESALQYNPEPVYWTPKGSRKTPRES